MRRLLAALIVFTSVHAFATLPFDTVFKGRSQFDRMIGAADQFKALPIGDRVANVGKFLCGTPYKSFTLEIDDHVEAPSANLAGLDCWTFFEDSLAFARMLDEPRDHWKPETFLKYIETDRYRGGQCSGSYLSRLHYLEDWLADNERRGNVKDLTRELGGVRAPHAAQEMTKGWKSYRYMRNNPDLRSGIADMEARVRTTPLYYIPKNKVAAIEPRLSSGDIIGVCDHDSGKVGTAHVGLAFRTDDGVLHFMHASSPRNYGKVVLDQELAAYLAKFRSHVGILVARPLR
ncbi:MAG TPA: N-acetylmuramoyl-L-alanine amidase-like domain-containing protein [Chthoniobacteraceae bacterium]|nr:N-acetylmuramoyl-L-alanine amidase-like domain-containing protein [Chthoniobacteraceae bacterium]